MSAEAVIKMIVGHLKPSLRTVFAFAMLYVAFLLSPDQWGIRSSINAILGNRVLILHGLGGLSLTYLATFPLSYAWKFGQAANLRRRSKDYLGRLSPKEKAILRRFIGEQRKSATLNLVDGDVQMLMTQRILIRLADVSRGHMNFDVCIQPWAYEYLMKNQRLLEGPEEQQSEHGWMAY